VASIITVSRLTKRYGDTVAVDDLSFDVERGSTFAFLGTNGAGKSTTISCVTTLKTPTSGEITVNGHVVGRDDRAIRRSIGAVFQESLLDPILTVRENLLVRASLYQISRGEARRRIDRLASILELDEFLDRRYGRLSGGQRRRADIVRALLHEPELLFLDEPTTGLDPDSREKVWATVTELQHQLGLTVFLTTHYMEETERADLVHIINHGKIVAAGTPGELRSTYARDELRLVLSDPRRFDRAFPEARRGGNERSLPVRSSRKALNVLLDFDSDIVDFEFHHGTMDDVFLNITRETG
jgi:multidrug/hemolysin transport system ATP-binding protein